MNSEDKLAGSLNKFGRFHPQLGHGKGYTPKLELMSGPRRSPHLLFVEFEEGTNGLLLLFNAERAW